MRRVRYMRYMRRVRLLRLLPVALVRQPSVAAPGELVAPRRTVARVAPVALGCLCTPAVPTRLLRECASPARLLCFAVRVAPRRVVALVALYSCTSTPVWCARCACCASASVAMTRVSCCSDDVVRYRECHAAASVAWPRVSRCCARDAASLTLLRVLRSRECRAVGVPRCHECRGAVNVARPQV